MWFSARFFLSFAVGIALLASGCIMESPYDLTGRKVLMVVCEEDFRDEELTIPRNYLRDAGATVEVASTDPSVARGTGGLEIDPDLGVGEAVADDYQAVIFVGGPGSKEYLWDNQAAQVLAEESFQSGKVVAAICLSPVVLARAGILGKNPGGARRFARTVARAMDEELPE